MKRAYLALWCASAALLAALANMVWLAWNLWEFQGRVEDMRWGQIFVIQVIFAASFGVTWLSILWIWDAIQTYKTAWKAERHG